MQRRFELLDEVSVRLVDDEPGPRSFEDPGVGPLMVVGGVRIGDQDRRNANARQFGQGGRPRPRYGQRIDR